MGAKALARECQISFAHLTLLDPESAEEEPIVTRVTIRCAFSRVLALSVKEPCMRARARAHLAHASPTTCSSPAPTEIGRSSSLVSSLEIPLHLASLARSLARASQPSRYSRCPREYNIREGLCVWELIESRCGNDIGIGIGIDKRSSFPRDHRRDVGSTRETRVSCEIHA